MLCNRCGTVVMFEKEDFVKMQFQDGTKKWWHLHPCFGLDFLEVQQVKKEIQNVTHPFSTDASGTLSGIWGSERTVLAKRRIGDV